MGRHRVPAWTARLRLRPVHRGIHRVGGGAVVCRLRSRIRVVGHQWRHPVRNVRGVAVRRTCLAGEVGDLRPAPRLRQLRRHGEQPRRHADRGASLRSGWLHAGRMGQCRCDGGARRLRTTASRCAESSRRGRNTGSGRRAWTAVPLRRDAPGRGRGGVARHGAPPRRGAVVGARRISRLRRVLRPARPRRWHRDGGGAVAGGHHRRRPSGGYRGGRPDGVDASGDDEPCRRSGCRIARCRSASGWCHRVRGNRRGLRHPRQCHDRVGSSCAGRDHRSGAGHRHLGVGAVRRDHRTSDLRGFRCRLDVVLGHHTRCRTGCPGAAARAVRACWTAARGPSTSCSDPTRGPTASRAGCR